MRDRVCLTGPLFSLFSRIQQLNVLGYAGTQIYFLSLQLGNFDFKVSVGKFQGNWQLGTPRC
jgi:predicted phage tail protein